MLETQPTIDRPKDMSKMAKTTSTTLALILALAAQPLLAQTEAAPATDEAAAEATAPADTAPATASPAEALALGQEVGAADGPGSTYNAATFESWEQKCVRTETGVDPCQLYMLLKDQQGNPVAEFTMFNLPKGSEGPAIAGANFIAPLETLLTAGMQLQIDDAKSKVYPFTFCGPVGCVARIGFTAEDIDAMKKGANAKITIVPFVAPDEKVELSISLKGFTAGYDAVTAANDAADEAAKAAGGAAPAAANE